MDIVNPITIVHIVYPDVYILPSFRYLQIRTSKLSVFKYKDQPSTERRYVTETQGVGIEHRGGRVSNSSIGQSQMSSPLSLICPVWVKILWNRTFTVVVKESVRNELPINIPV